MTTDLLMVNPNKGFKWHQDNQNGPVGSFRGVPVFLLSFFATWTWRSSRVRRARPRPASARLRGAAMARRAAFGAPAARLCAAAGAARTHAASTASRAPARCSSRAVALARRRRARPPSARHRRDALRQNSRIDARAGFDNALRWWVTMDDSPKDYGAPVYLKKSQNNKCVPEDAVFVNIDEGDLPEYHDFTTFRPKAGDLIVWHARTIHKIDGPTSQDWGSMKRRVLGGTVAIDDATYVDKEKVEFADMGRHSLKHGDPLTDPHFPKIWPRPDPAEVVARFNGDVGRSREGFGRMVGAMFSAKTFEQFASWGNVLKKKDQAVEEEEVEAREEVPASR